MSYETVILEKLESFKRVCLEVNKEEANVFVRCDPFSSMVADDGYNEIDFLFTLMIEPGIEKKIVLMFTKVSDGERTFIRELDDEDVWRRARKYCAGVGRDNYYGLSNGEEAIVRSLDPAVRFESTVTFGEFASLLRSIISGERRIKDSEEFAQALKGYFNELQPHVYSSLTVLLKDEEFKRRLARFLEPIGMAPEDEELPQETVSMISQQATYLVLDKILFLALLNESRDQLLPKLMERGDRDYAEVFKQLAEPLPEISGEDSKEWAARFWGTLEEKFRLIRQINYEPIFDPEASPLNEVSLKGDPSGCLVSKDILAFLYGKERLSKLFDGPLLSRIYEGLIPPELRWKWGQIYTPPEVTRLIAEWGVASPDDRVLDPACGTGRFLVSAYSKLRELKNVQGKEPTHQELLNQIYGIDINQFPAHLATMSLVALDLTSVTDDVNIKVSDFFHYQNYMQAKIGGEERRRIRLVGQTQMGKKGLSGQSAFTADSDSNKSLGPFDAILMNPPYTRQEALGKYKDEVRKVALTIARKGKKSKEVAMSKRASYYTYFMTHGTNFLEENGRFGMIVQNSWLDVDYGVDVQRFLLENCKIMGVFGCSKERLIKTADVNTVIVLLEKCLDENRAEEREQNLVSFVDLKKSLVWFENNYGFKELLEFIQSIKEDYVDSDLRVIVKTQKELWEEGFDDEQSEYIGSKWGKYIRAPDIFFKILTKGEDLLIPLRKVADITRGFTTGANDFFYLPKPGKSNRFFRADFDGMTGDLLLSLKDSPVTKQFEKQGFQLKIPMFRIEKEYWMHKEAGANLTLFSKSGAVFKEKNGIWVPNYVIKSPKEIRNLAVTPENLRYVVQMVDKEKKHLQKGVMEYIEWGEKWKPKSGERYSERPTCKSRTRWYSLPKLPEAEILFRQFFSEKFDFPINTGFPTDHTFYYLTNTSDKIFCAAFLNSTLGALFSELYGRVNMGEGVLTTYGPDVKPLLVLDRSSIKENLRKEISKEFQKLTEREIESIFKEVGAATPEDVSLDKVKQDRRKLDELVMGEILNLSKREQLEVYRGIVHLVKERLEKAQTGD